MRPAKLSLLIVTAWLCLAACNKPAATSTTPDSAIPEAEGRPTANLKQAMLLCREIRSTDEMVPLAEVSVQIGDKVTVVDSISVCNTFTAADYAQYEIPAAALMGCGGWWAGGGDYLYLLPDGDEVVLMAGWQDEGQEDTGFHYQEVRRFSRL
jgi:hypothetical protein